jgi:hypothetical protein
MWNPGNSRDEIRARIKPILDNVAVDGLRAWLRSIDLPSAAYSRVTITDLVSKQIAEGQLAEDALSDALIGFEEASDMRIYLFRMEETPSGKPESWLPTRLIRAGFALANSKVFASEKEKAMSPVYAKLEGGLLRVKWAERHERSKMNERGDGVILTPAFKRAVLIADFPEMTAELRLNPPDRIHPYEDKSGRMTAEAYYNAYIDKARIFWAASSRPSTYGQLCGSWLRKKTRESFAFTSTTIQTSRTIRRSQPAHEQT